MRRWLQDIIGRWNAKRTRTKELGASYRAYARNLAALENGEPI